MVDKIIGWIKEEKTPLLISLAVVSFGTFILLGYVCFDNLQEDELNESPFLEVDFFRSAPEGTQSGVDAGGYPISIPKMTGNFE